MPALLTTMSIAPCLRLDRGDAVADGVDVGDVEHRDVGLVARGGERAARRFERSEVAAVEHDGRARVGKRSGDGVAETACSAGDERDAAGQVERVGVAMRSSSGG